VATCHDVAVIGFTAFERSTLEAFFRLAARRSPSYRYVDDPQHAHVILLDTDREIPAGARSLAARALCVGKQSLAGQLAQMGRPINMMALLRLLDQCVAQGGPAMAAVAPVAAAPARSAAMAPPEVLVSKLDNILVVDDSDIALRFMANCLARFGFDVHLARSGEEALQRVSEQHFEFVFLDVTMAGIDGYQTCKLIKKRPYGAERRAPTVVMLTSRGGMVDKMRGTLSGCDAYLTKPLQQSDLMKVIGDRVPNPLRRESTEPARMAAHAH
jgi:two-component system cell cycle response regulator